MTIHVHLMRYVGADVRLRCYSDVTDCVLPFAAESNNSNCADWEDMYHIWDHTFQEVLGIDPSEHGSKIMLTTPPLNPTKNRMKLMETMFEHYGFSALNIQVQAGLTLFAQGKSFCQVAA